MKIEFIVAMAVWTNTDHVTITIDGERFMVDELMSAMKERIDKMGWRIK